MISGGTLVANFLFKVRRRANPPCAEPRDSGRAGWSDPGRRSTRAFDSWRKNKAEPDEAHPHEPHVQSRTKQLFADALLQNAFEGKCSAEYPLKNPANPHQRTLARRALAAVFNHIATAHPSQARLVLAASIIRTTSIISSGGTAEYPFGSEARIASSSPT